IGLSWSRGSAALAASLVRDVSGPVSSAVASRLCAGPLRIYSRLERVAGGETRIGLGLETRVPLGLRCFVAHAEGPVLAESRSGGIEWRSGSVQAAQKPHARAHALAPVDSGGEAKWDSLAAQDALEDGIDPDAVPPVESGDPVEVVTGQAPGEAG